MQQSRAGRVKRRHVFFVAGYHPMRADEHFRVFTRELQRFASVWSVSARCEDARPIPTSTGALWHVHTQGQGWETDATFELLAWDDLVRADMERPLWSHFAGSVRALADMFTSGTLKRYFGASRRYGLFFLFTYLALLVIWALAMGLGFVMGHLLAPYLGTAPAALLAGLAGLACGLGLMRWPGRRLRLRQSLDLAEFSVDYARNRHPALDARVRAFGRRIAEVVKQADAEGLDEVVIAGHSLGAMHLVSAVAEALREDPDFGRHVPVRLLTLGSTTIKFALHPAGERLRKAAHEVAAASWIGWLEIQSRDDIVSFYKVNPVTLAPAQIMDQNSVVGDFSARPLIRHTAIEDMLTPATYRRFHFDIMRLHCQCFLANDKRSTHEFHAYICGPVRFDRLAATTSGLMDFVDEAGALRNVSKDAAKGGESSPDVAVSG
ncbi:hypothetical protein ACT6QH_12615 [Xanthobacter sp. TB0139]|uniref:hypothetical protein n=1 Tax=Xanthobacter sp. TB0139 TaxID=3459178 RepID=UPI00403A59DA